MNKRIAILLVLSLVSGAALAKKGVSFDNKLPYEIQGTVVREGDDAVEWKKVPPAKSLGKSDKLPFFATETYGKRVLKWKDGVFLYTTPGSYANPDKIEIYPGGKFILTEKTVLGTTVHGKPDKKLQADKSVPLVGIAKGLGDYDKLLISLFEKKDEAKLIAKLKEHGVKLDYVFASDWCKGMSLVHMAAFYGLPTLMDMLLSAIKDVNVKAKGEGHEGMTPLHWALYGYVKFADKLPERRKIVSKLVERGARFDVRDAKGAAPLDRMIMVVGEPGIKMKMDKNVSDMVDFVTDLYKKSGGKDIFVPEKIKPPVPAAKPSVPATKSSVPVSGTKLSVPAEKKITTKPPVPAKTDRPKIKQAVSIAGRVAHAWA